MSASLSEAQAAHKRVNASFGADPGTGNRRY